MSELEKTDLKIFMLRAWNESMKVLRDTNDPRKAADAFVEKVEAL